MCGEIRLIQAADTLPLRSSVLRNGAPLAECRFEEDDRLPNFHLGGFEAGRLVAIASLYEEPLPDHPGAGWHLRGMAVAPEFQNQGVGGRLLDHALDLLAREHQADYVWCNARRVACGFYLGHGFEFISGEFEIPGIGPHRRMVRDL